MDKELVFITVIGEDKKGIVARISGLLYESNANIEDISQGVMQGYFVMTMLADVKDANRSFDSLSAGLQTIGRDLGLQVQVQHQNIFKAMHRI